jgi:ribokinase
MLVILGSVNADLLFKVQKLPAPGETVLCPGYTMAPGAKAGARTHFIGHLGDDAYGPIVRGLLVDAGIDCTHLATSARPTAIAVIGVDEAGENAIIVASGANLDTAAGQVPDDLLGKGTTLLCQNEIRMSETAAILARGKAAGARTILNLAPAGPLDAAVLATLDVLVVNEIEARMAAGTTEGEPVDLARRLAAAHHLTCVVTLGAAGAIAVGQDGGWRTASLRIKPVDTTGAGDAFVGVLAAALDAGRPMPEALHRASIGAGLACLAMGAQSAQPHAAEISSRLGELPPPSPLD